MKGYSRAMQFLIPGVIVLLGAVTLVFGFIRLHNYNTFTDTTAEVMAVNSYYDTDDSLHRDIYVRYTVDGETFDELLDESGSGYRKGQIVNIRYNPDNPAEITSGKISGSILTIAFGLVVVLVGAFTFVKSLRSNINVTAKPPWES